MNYEYIKGVLNVTPHCSAACSIWKNRQTGIYYISRDYKQEIVQSVPDNSYMLLSDTYKKPERKWSPYRDNLSPDAKQITALDFLRGTVEYSNSYWKLNKD